MALDPDLAPFADRPDEFTDAEWAALPTSDGAWTRDVAARQDALVTQWQALSDAALLAVDLSHRLYPSPYSGFNVFDLYQAELARRGLRRSA
jgi:hypothetical protein